MANTRSRKSHEFLRGNFYWRSFRFLQKCGRLLSDHLLPSVSIRVHVVPHDFRFLWLTLTEGSDSSLAATRRSNRGQRKKRRKRVSFVCVIILSHRVCGLVNALFGGGMETTTFRRSWLIGGDPRLHIPFSLFE